jgi:predicted unusual protein kinase regulating ubiquinone biosynthesis (AarF/ABC1/UbiB family)
MYNDMIYRNDELKRDLEQADRKAAHGWRVWDMRSRESRLLDRALAVLGRTFIALGQWLVARRGEPIASGQLGLTSAA